MLEGFKKSLLRLELVFIFDKILLLNRCLNLKAFLLRYKIIILVNKNLKLINYSLDFAWL